MRNCLLFLLLLVPLSAYGQGVVRITDGQDIADVTTNGEVEVSITSGSVTATGGDEKAEDAAHASGATGSFVLGVANEAGTALAADGDYIPTATDTSGRTIVVGPVADGAAVAGRPVRIGAKDGSGNTQDILVADDGSLLSKTASLAGADAESNTVTTPTNAAGTAAVRYLVRPEVFNGTTADRLRGDTNGLYVVVKKAPTAATIDTSATAQTADFTVEAATASLRLTGWSIREDAGTPAAATVVLRHDADGTCDGTAVVAFIELDANQSLQMNYGDRGLSIANGLCADVLAGSVSFVAHLVTEAAP